MNQKEILDYIKKLTDEEQNLFTKIGITNEERERLHQIDAELTQYWDLLRQRRALRNAGKNPSGARLRKKNVVKNYEQ